MEENHKNLKDMIQEKETLIQEAKQAIFEELGITPERQDELTPIHQKIMEDIKQIFKDNGIEDLFERSFILNNISEKCDNVSKLYYLVANGEKNAKEEETNGREREDNE